MRTVQLPGECALFGSIPAGPGTSCTPDPCGPTAVRPGTWGAFKAIYRQLVARLRRGGLTVAAPAHS